MTNEDNCPKDAADHSAGSGQDLRQKAEALAQERAGRTSQDIAALSPEEIRKTLHELLVHQIELEMQNEELRTAQAEIEAGRERYFDLYELAPVGYCTLSGQGLILEANLTAAVLLDTARGALVRQPISRFILKEDQDIYYLHHKKLVETGEPQEWELRLVKPDGEHFWAHLTATASQAEDESPLCRVAISDITDRKQAEKTLRESEAKLRELNITKDKFFNIIAHDLRSPFNSIIGLSELLVEQVNAKDYEGIDKYASIIKQSAHRATDLLMNLLEWSLTQTGRIEYNPEHFELVDIIKGNLMLFDDIARQKSISIKKVLPSTLILIADKAMIKTVIRNLLSNAIKFTGQGGEVVISARSSPTEILVSVKDSGTGIASDRIEKLFRIDTSESTPGTNKEGGTGLGLILCKEFVEKHGGKIWVESIENKGTVFTFTLPGNQSSYNADASSADKDGWVKKKPV